MPPRAKSICRAPGCGTLIDKPGHCDRHKKDDRAKAWGRKDPAYARAYGHDWSTRIRPWVMTRDNGLCQACLRTGQLTPASEVDHIVPVSQGGTNDLGNLEAICHRCHTTKTAAESRQGRVSNG